MQLRYGKYLTRGFAVFGCQQTNKPKPDIGMYIRTYTLDIPMYIERVDFLIWAAT